MKQPPAPALPGISMLYIFQHNTADSSFYHHFQRRITGDFQAFAADRHFFRKAFENDLLR